MRADAEGLPRPLPPGLEEVRRRLLPLLRKGGALKAIVFGSRARGQEDAYSDLDLIVVVETELPFVRRHELFPGIYRAWGRALDLLIYTPRELAEMRAQGNPFIRKALEEGVVIYEEQL